MPCEDEGLAPEDDAWHSSLSDEAMLDRLEAFAKEAPTPPTVS